MKKALVLWLLLLGGCAADGRQSEAPAGLRTSFVVEVDRDDIVIDDAFVAKMGSRTMKVRFAPGAIEDRNGDGVLKVWASNVALECEGMLCGTKGGPPDKFAGTGVRIEGARNVTVKGLEVTGYKVGLRASRTDELRIDGARFDNLWRMHLKSTKEKEHNDDWLWPHENDKQEWVTNYGAAVCIERSAGVAVSNVRVRNGQNGIVLDRVSRGAVCDNDCSFLSGWGVAMWRSSGNVIERNALDFCVRGYSHGVYNRGQDSAGLLMFEQCCDNQVRLNSVTHGGDGVFAFAGKEALGEKKVAGLDCTRRGCDDNQFVGNDLSFSAAHGLELTFSFGNRIAENTMEGNAICGLWGGYSQETEVCGNRFIGNGLKGYGEGGGVNIEHGYHNVIEENEFSGNSVAVKLWDDDDGALLKTPWAVANHQGCLENAIRKNRVSQAGGAAFWLRGAKLTLVAENTGRIAADGTPGVDADTASGSVQGYASWIKEPLAPCVMRLAGVKKPVGARDAWRGREWIRMGEWGPIEPDAK
jgi:nitrous oxidase accessory protein NosD